MPRFQGLVLRVRNVEQKVLFENELRGQLSDGQWENARPDDHWIMWCDAQVVVDPENPGRNFVPRRASYDFGAKDLLDCVGDRMLEAVRLATGRTDYDMAAMRKDLRDLQRIIKLYVADSVPLPEQPAERKLRLIVDGYAQTFTVYRDDIDDDQRAIDDLEERRVKSAQYRLRSLEQKAEAARVALAKAEAEVAACKQELGMLI